VSARADDRSALFSMIAAELVTAERDCGETRGEVTRALDPELPAVPAEHLALSIRPLIATLRSTIDILCGALLDLGLDDDGGGR
jgi:hypothetical protein